MKIGLMGLAFGSTNKGCEALGNCHKKRYNI